MSTRREGKGSKECRSEEEKGKKKGKRRGKQGPGYISSIHTLFSPVEFQCMFKKRGPKTPDPHCGGRKKKRKEKKRKKRRREITGRYGRHLVGFI